LERKFDWVRELQLWAQEADFFQGGQKEFPLGPTVVKFYFTNRKPRKKLSTEKLIGKYKISNSSGRPSPLSPSDVHERSVRKLFHYGRKGECFDFQIYLSKQQLHCYTSPYL